MKKLSAAVVVDGTYTVAEDGTNTYQARAPEGLANYEKLVKTDGSVLLAMLAALLVPS